MTFPEYDVRSTTTFQDAFHSIQVPHTIWEKAVIIQVG